jgi:hypothetical protein
MAKMLHLLLDWEYPHWMMMAGDILVASFVAPEYGGIPAPRLREAPDSSLLGRLSDTGRHRKRILRAGRRHRSRFRLDCRVLVP